MSESVDPRAPRPVDPAGDGRPSRREFIAVGVGALAIAALPRAVKPERRLIRATRPVMGTLAEIGVVARDPRRARGAMDAAFAELVRVERAMSRFRTDSEIGRVNAAADGTPVAVSEETLGVVEDALRWADASGGGFDPALGRAAELWSIESRTEPPSAVESRRFADRALWRAVETGRFRGSPVIRLHEPDAALDLGGIAKGHGVDRAVAALREWGVTSGMVNVGGDLYALGESPEGDPWRVGVRDPSRPDGVSTTFEVVDRAVATSGDYERFFEHRGRRYHHLLDPRTGEPRSSEIHGVTVLADDVRTADVAGTTVFGRDPARARRLVETMAPDVEVRYG